MNRNPKDGVISDSECLTNYHASARLINSGYFEPMAFVKPNVTVITSDSEDLSDLMDEYGNIILSSGYSIYAGMSSQMEDDSNVTRGNSFYVTYEFTDKVNFEQVQR